MPPRLRVGILGLGRRWQRYRSALLNLHRSLEVRAVCDPLRHRADRLATELGCIAAAGPVELLERTDVEALLLLDRAWYGLWPLELACRAGKPVFCAPSLAGDDAYADRLRGLVRENRLPVLMVMPVVVAPAMEALLAHLAERPASSLSLHLDVFHPFERSSWSLPSGLCLALFHVCATLLGTAPLAVRANPNGESELSSLSLEFPLGNVAYFTARPGFGRFLQCHVQALTATGLVEARLPRRLSWRDAAGRHALIAPPTSLPERLLTRFVTDLRSGQPLSPSFEDAYQALTRLRAARKSLTEGRPLPLDAPASNQVT
jgi:predicted dehydrogenase